MSLFSTLDEEIYHLKMKIQDLKRENRLYKKAALDWMAEYDELKNIYEEEVPEESE